MQTTIMMIDCASERAEEIAEALCHIAGVSESYVTAAASCRVIAVLRMPDIESYNRTAAAVTAVDGVSAIVPVPVISARAADDLARIRADYE